MLYDKRWDRQVTGLPLWSIGDFIAFLETKDPTETFDFCQARTCAVAQYLQARGVEEYSLDPSQIPGPIKAVVISGTDETFGSALLSARYAAASRWGRAKMIMTRRAPSAYRRWCIRRHQY